MSVVSPPPAACAPQHVGLSSAALGGIAGSRFFSAAAGCWLVLAWLAEYDSSSSTNTWLALWSACGASGLVGVLLTWWLGGNLLRSAPPQAIYFGGRLLEVIAILLGGWGVLQPLAPLLWAAAGVWGIATPLIQTGQNELLRQLAPERRLLWGNGLALAASACGAAAVLAVAAGIDGWSIGPTSLQPWTWILPWLFLSGASLLSCFAIQASSSSEPASRLARWPWTHCLQVCSEWRLSKSRALSWWSAAAAAGGVYALLLLPGLALETTQFAPVGGWWLVTLTLLGLALGAVTLGGWSQRAELGLIPWGWLGMAVAIVWLNLIPLQTAEIVKATDQTLLSALGACLCLGFSWAAVWLPMTAHGQRLDEPDMRNGLLTITTILCLVATWGAAGGLIWWEHRPVVDRFSALPPKYQASSLSPQDWAAWDRIQQSATEYGASRPQPLAAGAWLEHVARSWAQSRPSTTEPTADTVSSGVTGTTPSHVPLRLPFAVAAAGFHTELQLRREAGVVPRLREYWPAVDAIPLDPRQLKNAFVYSSFSATWSYRQRLFLLTLLVLPLMAYAAWRLPQAMARVFFWTLFRCVYRVRVNGLENIPATGGAVLVSNHTSWIDGLTIILMSGRKIRMIAWAGNFNNPFMRFWGWFSGVILITGGPKSIQRGLAEARKALTRGELVGIFPEGGITRSGQVQGFRPGLLKILDQLPVPIVPVYIDQLWGSIFTYAGGKTIWRLPNSFRHRLTVNLGPPLRNPRSIHEVRQAVTKLSADCVAHRQGPFESCAAKLIRTCKRRKFRWKVTDSTDQVMSGGSLLMRSLILRRLLRRKYLAADETYVGVLIPPSSGAVLGNAALALDRRVAVNLNYTLTPRLIGECIRQAEVRHVLTSRKVLEKLNLTLDCEVIFAEDLKDQVTWSDKLWAGLQTYVVPARWLTGGLGLAHLPPAEPLTVIFTSGSTGVPKGVVLSQLNIASNVDSIYEAINLNSQDTLIGALPFFHSFGYTVTFWGVLGLDVRGAYHFNPLEATQIAKLTRKHRGTVLLGTPTFLRSYLKRCQREDFATLNIVIAGAEKMPQELAVAFEHRFGIRPVEGYGATETAPIVAVNIPPTRSCGNFQVDCKDGTVGRAISNVAVKITDLADDSHELDAKQSGMLWVKGPNVMLGYLHRPDLTSEAIVDGWYRTGDVAEIDDDGFLRLTGRMSRFSKIGGEMIPHIQIEDALLATYRNRDLDVPPLVVTSVPDPKKGERIVVLLAVPEREPAEMCQLLKEQGLPNLYIPSQDSFFRIDAVPVLGSGKLDLKQIKDLALQLTHAANRPAAGDSPPQR